jgi:glycosyltransferase involved in cell wall biosynthesis
MVAPLLLGSAMTSPVVSIVLPVFNGGQYLHDAIESLLGQSHQDFEIVAIDDGSTDGSLDVLNAAQRRDARIRVISRENRGLISTLNQGLVLARGRFVARMDADDIAYPDRLAAQLRKFAANPGAAMCGTGFDTLFGDRISPGGLEEIYETGKLSILSKFYTIFIHSTVMYDRSVLDPSELRYDTAYPHAEDFDLFRRIARDHKVIAERRSLLAYRLHNESVSSLRKAEMRRTHVCIVDENLSEFGFNGLKLMENAVEKLDGTSIRGLVAFLGSLDRWIDDRDPIERESWRQGFVHLFYFFYRMVCDSNEPALVRLFLDGTQQHNLVRRRERLIARSRGPFGSSAVLWRGLSLVDALERRVSSRPFSKPCGLRT